MSAMFESAEGFDADLSDWDVGAVTDMSAMFESAEGFDADLSNWDVGAVTNMNSMFYATASLSDCNRYRIKAGWGDDLISENWLTGSSIYGTGGIYGEDRIPGECAAYCASGLCDAYPSCVAGFHGAVDGRLCLACPAEMSCAGGADRPVFEATDDSIYAAVQTWLADPVGPAATHGHIATWDVSKVTNMDGLFCAEISCGTNFPDGGAFSDDISAWDVAAVTSMRHMFHSASSFNADLSGWDVGRVQDTTGMFAESVSLSDCNRYRIAASWPILAQLTSTSRLDTPSATSTSLATVVYQVEFYGCVAVCGAGLCSAYPSCAAGYYGTAHGAPCFACPAGHFCVGSDGQPSLADNDSIKTAVGAWLANPTAAQATYGHISTWDVSRVQSMDDMFKDASGFDADLSGWDVAAVTSMAAMFKDASSFDADLSGWDVGRVRSMIQMFDGASSFDADLSGWNVAAVQSMSWMFDGASSLSACNRFRIDASWEIPDSSSLAPAAAASCDTGI